jgi:GNAT superfamily N-acetyltransferase
MKARKYFIFFNMNLENVSERQPLFTPFVTKNLSAEDREMFLQKILFLEQKIFPADWQYEDAEVYYRKMLESSSAINIFLCGDNNEVVGYLLARPLSEVYKELAQDDPELKDDEYCYYIETVGVLSEYSGIGGFTRLLNSLQEEVAEKECTSLSAHTRTVNGFAESLERKCKEHLLVKRAIKTWSHGGGEPYVYLQWAIKKKEC